MQADLPDIFDNDNHFDIDAYLQILESSHMNQSSDSNVNFVSFFIFIDDFYFFITNLANFCFHL